ncbi:MAG: MAPEG family protein [Myxococcota bacterium]
MPDPTQLHGPVAVTVAYFVLWYAMLFGLQSRTKYRLKALYAQEGKTFDRYFGQDPQMLAADRAVANTHEQMVPFMVSLWLYACFVSPSHATWLGAAYVGLRGLYPVLLGSRVSKVQSKRVAFVTFPCYAIVFFMLGGTAWASLGG